MATLLGKVIRKAGDIAEDVGKSAAIIPNQSYKSLTGKDLISGLTDTNTKVGSVLVGANKLGIDTGHKALQGYANAVTGNLAGGLHEKIVPGIQDKQQIDYDTKIFDKGVLSTFEDSSKKLSPIVGSIAPSVLAPKPKDPAPTQFETKPRLQIEPASSGNVLPKILTQKPADQVTTLSSITTGLQQANTATGGALGTLANTAVTALVQNIMKPKPTAPTQAVQLAQQASLSEKFVPAVQEGKPMNALQNSVFGSGGISVKMTDSNGNTIGANTGGSSSGGGFAQWWSSNSVWLIPVSIIGGIVGTIFVIISFFRKGRR